VVADQLLNGSFISSDRSELFFFLGDESLEVLHLALSCT